MKKNLTFGRNRILCALFALSSLFSACSEKPDGQKKEETPTTVEVGYSFTMNQEYLNLVDVTIDFWNEKGEKKTETMTSTRWNKTFTLTNSQEFGYTVTTTAKPNIDDLLTADAYKMEIGYTDSYISSEGATDSFSSNTSFTISKEKIKEYIAKYPERHKFSKKWNKDTDTFTN